MRLLRYAAALAAASLLLLGCSANGDYGSTQSGEAADIEEHAAPEAAEFEEDTAGGTPPAQVDTADRAVVYEASLSVRHADPEAVAESAWDLA